MKSLVLFHNKSGVGKTTLTFNLAHMLARRGHRTVVLDCDPQCNLSSLLLREEEQLVELWQQATRAGQPTPSPSTVSGCVEPVRRGTGGVLKPELVSVAPGLWLLPGHLSLSRFEQSLAEEWAERAEPDNTRALDVTTSLDLLSNMAADQVGADIVMLDLGPNLGALNRAALLACDAVIIPVAPDLFSLQGLADVGPILRDWRQSWDETCKHHLRGRAQEHLPLHRFQPIGYLLQQYPICLDRMPVGYMAWAREFPRWFHQHILGEPHPPQELEAESDEQCIAILKHLSSLVTIAQVARKPLFDLKQADGIGSGQLQLVTRCRHMFEELTEQLLQRLDQMHEARPLQGTPGVV